MSANNADADRHLAETYYAGGQLEQALASCHRSLKLNPSLPQAYKTLGNVLQAQGKIESAARAYLKAIALAPEFAEARANLGNLYGQQGKLSQAISHYRVALELEPDSSADILHPFGVLLKQQGQLDEAIALFQKALKKLPNPSTYYSLGDTLALQGKHQEALICFQKTVQLDPNITVAYRQMAAILGSRGKINDQLACYQKLLEIEPTDALHLQSATVVPTIYQSLDDLQAWRQRIVAGLNALQQPLKIEDPFKEGCSGMFYLAYQGLNDKPIQSLMARLYRPCLPETVASPAKARKKDKRIRLGFISRYFYDHSVARCFGELIQKMPRDKFHISLFAPLSPRSDRVSEALKANADNWIKLPLNLQAARELIAAEGLDILTYTDIGMERFTYFLAFTRLAKAQCVLTGHPVTTGIPTIDYFISSDLMEIEEAQEHYSETLVRLKGLPVCYPKPELPTNPKDRAALGLPEDSHLYLCPMTLFKVHPEFDIALAEILRRDPKGKVLFFQYYNSPLHELLKARFQETMPDVASRIQFLPWASMTDFINILSLAEVVLDTFHFVGGNTTLITLATGTPMVTWPSPYLRGRISYGYYRRMGVMDCVAATQSEYVDIAVRIGTDPDYRAMLKNKIMQNHDILYNNLEAVEETANFFLSLVR